jgi:hypothetical protein
MPCDYQGTYVVTPHCRPFTKRGLPWGLGTVLTDAESTAVSSVAWQNPFSKEFCIVVSELPQEVKQIFILLNLQCELNSNTSPQGGASRVTLQIHFHEQLLLCRGWERKEGRGQISLTVGLKELCIVWIPLLLVVLSYCTGKNRSQGQGVSTELAMILWFKPMWGSRGPVQVPVAGSAATWAVGGDGSKAAWSLWPGGGPGRLGARRALSPCAGLCCGGPGVRPTWSRQTATAYLLVPPSVHHPRGYLPWLAQLHPTVTWRVFLVSCLLWLCVTTHSPVSERSSPL